MTRVERGVVGDMDHIIGLIVGMTGLAIFIAVAWYILSQLRSRKGASASPTLQETLEEYGRMYDEGEISREEYRAIRSALAASFTSYVLRSETQEEERMSDREAQLRALLKSEER